MAGFELTDLTADTSPSSTDIGYSVKDPGGTPLDRKVTWLDAIKAGALGVLTSNGDLLTRAAGAITRITRADLAADTAFSSVYMPTSLGLTTATVATSQTTTSTSFTDLATSGPAANVTIRASGSALVLFGASLSNDTDASLMSFAVSGTSTVAAADTAAIRFGGASVAAGDAQFATFFVVTGLTPGSGNIFTAKYRVNAGTGTFYNRRILVIPL